jgi:hypothetical protein
MKFVFSLCGKSATQLSPPFNDHLIYWLWIFWILGNGELGFKKALSFWKWLLEIYLSIGKWKLLRKIKENKIPVRNYVHVSKFLLVMTDQPKTFKHVLYPMVKSRKLVFNANQSIKKIANGIMFLAGRS